MPPRFYVPEARAAESTIDLPEDEAAHLTRVLRLTTGDPIRIFNGRGEEWDARVDAMSKQRVSARLLARVPAVSEPRIAITLAVAVLKGDKMDDVVRDSVMLGVARIVPLLTERTETSRAALERSARVARWQRIAVSSAKQCGRAVLPEVTPPTLFDELIAVTNDAILLVEPSADADVRALRDVQPARETERPQMRTVFVGPEGGWSGTEVQRARESGAMLLTLGAQTLRADAVPVVALTALRVRLEDF